MKRLTLACLAAPGPLAAQAVLLADSIRTFGGALADSPVWVFVPESAPLEVAEADRLAALHVRVVPFLLADEVRAFPFAAKTAAAAAAEALAENQAEILAWLDTGSLVIQEPGDLLLPPDVALGYRPVDHRLVGSLYHQPLDDFWTLIYEDCGVPEDHVFPMVPSVEDKAIRPYFNAGMPVVRPARGLLRAWAERFLALYDQDRYRVFYEQQGLYRIFIHQAVLTGVILAALAPDEMLELPYRVNYPLHMHADYPPDRRPARLNDLVSLRYEEIFAGPDWPAVLPVDEPLLGWLKARVGG